MNNINHYKKAYAIATKQYGQFKYAKKYSGNIGNDDIYAFLIIDEIGFETLIVVNIVTNEVGLVDGSYVEAFKNYLDEER